MTKKILSALMVGAMLTITACGGTQAGSQTKEVTVKGMHEGLKVKVTATKEKIEKVEIVENKETPDIAAKALKNVPEKIVKNNKTTVDGEAGATVTSDAIKKAVETALQEMGFDVSKFK
ncbi:hypothetical protein ABB02_00010 [Clostridiaceae bacterium JG1575]|nr:hypothetical protein ABB02_00010 [Clostridiaceae bacterium JG1575]